MANPATIQHNGALSASPSTGAAAASTLNEVINTTFLATYSARKSGSISVAGATDAVPFVLALETIVKVRLLVLKVSTSMVAKVTSAKGADQAIPNSSLLLLHIPAAGDELTAIKFVGTFDLEYVIAGDVS